ncbi:MAG: hypothetical protein H7296_02025 [Bacteroidia bacterium]|nr:hypothetical protein [Bacteroidia bacterium]
MKNFIFTLLIAFLFFACNTETKNKNSIATHVRAFHQNGKAGFETQNDSGEVIVKIEPIYDCLAFYTSNTLGAVDIGEFYLDDRNFSAITNDRSTLDPNESKTLPFDANKLIGAKKNNKCGLLYSTGKEAIAFEYDSIKIFSTALNVSDGPLFVLIKNNRVSMLNQKKEVVLSEKIFQKYYPGLLLKAQLHALEIAFMNGQLLVQQNGRFIDTIRTQPATTSLFYLGNKIDTVEEAPMDFDEYYFKGGEYNVVNAGTGKLLFDEWQHKIILKFTSVMPPYKTIFIDPTNKDSAMYAVNPFAGVNDVTTKVEFVAGK